MTGPSRSAGTDVVLRADRLHVGFPGRPDVLDAASVEVVRGRRLAVVGSNGSGKTTLLRTLAGSLRPRAGEVSVDGVVLRSRRSSMAEHRRQVQLVLQDPDDQLFSADVRSDVAFGPTNLGLTADEVEVRVAATLAVLEIADLADRPVHHLSFGQRKRVAIAGAIAMRPSVLLLDEPTAGLDPAGIDALLTSLASLEAAGTTVVMSTHDVDLAWRWADDVAVVAGGSIVQRGLTDALCDVELLRATGLRQPWQVALLARLRIDPDASAPPRSVSDVAAVLITRGTGGHVTSEAR